MAEDTTETNKETGESERMSKTRITVKAHGKPGSLARRIQEDPSTAIALIEAVREFNDVFKLKFPLSSDEHFSDPNRINLKSGKLLRVLQQLESH